MLEHVRLSLLDRSRTRAGEPDAVALRDTVERAVRAERLGYHRFWVAEHQGVPGIASGSPPVLMAAVAARTERSRVGSGGVMLPNHQPLVVAEQFAMREALFPGRIDFGVGRSLGFTPPVRRALRRGADEPDTFAEDLAELRDHLGGRQRGRRDRGWTPRPGLRTGDRSRTCGRGCRGTPGAEPYVVVSLDVLVADSVAAARELALPEAWALAAARTTGEFPALEPVAGIASGSLSARQRSVVDAAVGRTVHGDAGTVAAELEGLLAHPGADEVLASTSTFDRAALTEFDTPIGGTVRVMNYAV
ncbi:MsnO8 family LLM class oxidoreductase [Pseudonocardia sp. H11422]|uniref:MsnO8 family LLM class oxidoreductase n=1 Tax=Pseudonocardia sp. H11422 TaxID=2835866 RepID=UPI001BDCC5D2|nr:MsnO8 family LLM class oxidoreductase [Pseudonocardia sp. H11422]